MTIALGTIYKLWNKFDNLRIMEITKEWTA